MFNLKNFKLVKELKDIKPKINWMKYAGEGSKVSTPSDLLNSIEANSKFINEDLKIRAMVEEMLVKEFSPKIKDIKSYDFLVDSVVNKLKQKQLGKVEQID